MNCRIYLFLLASILLAAPLANATLCPKTSEVDHYVVTKLRVEDKGQSSEKISVYYKLLHPYDPQKPTLLVINGGPGGDHRLIDMFQDTELDRKMNILSFDHRGLGCTRSLSPWDPEYEKGIYSMARASDDIEAIRKDLLGDEGKWFVLGISYGSFLGQQYAIKYPQHINSMILDSAFYDTKAIDISRQQYIPLFIRQDAVISNLFDKVVQKYSDLKPAILAAIFPYTYSYDGRTRGLVDFLTQLDTASSREGVENLLGDYMDMNIPMSGMIRHIICEEIWDFKEDLFASDYWSIFNYNCGVFKNHRLPMAFGEALKTLNVPIFIFGGRFDPVTPIQVMREMHQILPNSLMWEHPYAGHALIVESADCMFKLADMFFSDSPKEAILSVANSKACQSPPLIKFAQTQQFFKQMTASGMVFPLF